ncbi:hypothetical protein VNO77_19087 [Canavalia gladiata]|uniref:Uncharacterized protein n=1 Tax=Canavalia gladiata TaxID=3824 RepID=A0AAN9LM46_CANGL
MSTLPQAICWATIAGNNKSRTLALETSARRCSDVPCKGHAILTRSQNPASFRVTICSWGVIYKKGLRIPLFLLSDRDA